jgi:CheY-like chemotaxis protein
MPPISFSPVDRSSGDEEMPLSGEGESSEPQRGLPRILVVDDERRIADTLAEILQMSGFHVATAYDGWEALRVAARFRPECVLSDVLMPRMSGVDLGIALRKMYPGTRVLLFSGQAGISDLLLDGQRQGFEFELIAKPIHPLKLIEFVKGQ